MSEQQRLFEMLHAGVTPFACVQECERRLSENGFENIDYTETWNLVPGGKYMVNHHGTTLFAFTVGEKQTENCAIIHIEKADTAYEGSYAAINNLFVSNTMTDFEFINREEDMGLEGLRKAKMSYRPLRMIIKYKCTAK